MFRHSVATHDNRKPLLAAAAGAVVAAGTATAVSGRAAKHHATETAAEQLAAYRNDVHAAIQAEPVRARVEEEISHLERLARLHEQGELTDEEFTTVKSHIMAS